MSQWGGAKRITGLRDRLLPRLGANWRGTHDEFLEFTLKTIRQMPVLVRDAMERHYITGGTQYKHEETGRPATEDSRYYILLSEGRSILATQIMAYQNDKSIHKLLERVYGQ